MPLLVYRHALYANTAENLQFKALAEELKKRVDAQDKKGKLDLCIFVGNHNFAEKEFDAFLIKKNGIILIEFKNYGGNINIDNNKWTVEYEGETGIVKGGSGNKTPFEQARNNRNAFIRNMVDSGALSEATAKKIASLVVFNHDSNITNNLRLNIQTWLYICDNSHFFGTAESIVNNNMDFSVQDIKRLADRIVLDDDDIVEEFSSMDFLDIWENDDLLAKYSDRVAGIIHFSDKPDIVHEHEDAFQLPRMVKHYIDICVNQALPGAGYEVFDCTQSYPAVPFSITKQYLIKVNSAPEPESVSALQDFIRSKCYAGNNCIYWLFGSDIIPIGGHKVDEKEVEEKTSKVSSTILAPWLDSFIFNKMGATYDPRYERFNYNDDLSEEEAKIYLGTYFPRSYAENFIIFERLFLNETFRRRIEEQKRIVIFSLGAGTGGDIIGLLTAIDKYLTQETPITVVALDANQPALTILEDIIRRYERLGIRRIAFTSFNIKITSEQELGAIAEKAFPDKSVDFLLCSKMGCELHGKKEFQDNNVYFTILEAFKEKISDNGLISLLDVTTKVDGTRFMPQLLNNGVNRFVSENEEFSSILPTPCAEYERQCHFSCFTQQVFYVNHCKKSMDISKICYRIIARRPFAEEIIRIPKGKYAITDKDGSSASALCQMSVDNDTLYDGFELIK